MKENEFLRRLEQSIFKLPDDEKNEILADYKEHFSVGRASGKTDDEISLSLGKPETIGRAYLADYSFGRVAEQTGFAKRAGWLVIGIVAAVGLGVFNLIFLSIPFLIVVFLLLGGWGISFVAPIVGIALLFSWPFSIAVPGLAFVSLLFAGTGFIFLGCFLLTMMILLTYGFFLLVIKYLKANVRLILQERT